MDDQKILDRWLRSKSDEAKDVVMALLVRYFGSSAVKYHAGSHQLRIKCPDLDGQPGFGIGGYLSIPVDHGQRVKNYYLKRIARAIDRLKEDD